MLLLSFGYFPRGYSVLFLHRPKKNQKGLTLYCSLALFVFLLFFLPLPQKETKRSRRKEGNSGASSQPELPLIAACSFFSQAKNALPLASLLFLTFLRVCHERALGTCPELASGGLQQWRFFGFASELD